MTISFDYSNALPFMQQTEVDYLDEFVKVAHNRLHEKKDQVLTFLVGWIYRITMIKMNFQE
ncbi:hypothetical protein HNP81_002466 [Peribacillus huizhouensis]|uniref:Uncharacterized protein n=1 Tax=Peribacillus huizhouensis TaxID=1501239 RepID=A0ABR6CQI2_9BACI|nr:hypothetical protein [Peribacillus huizhouensis]